MHPSSRALDPPPFATPAHTAACRELIRTGSRSFHAASMLLPEDIREGAYALYGFCRLSDDAIDCENRDAGAIDRLRARLDKVYAGDPGPHAVDRPLADTVRRFAIPRETFDALIEGLQWDVDARVYETQSDLDAYAARVAGAVGAMMAALMGVRSRALLARACDLGVAMQYTNIARDVGEDARAGRLYLPRSWMREAGIDPDAWLAAPSFTPALGGVIARVLRRADVLYRRADSGIAQLPAAVRPAIHASRLLYAEIGAEVVRRGFDSVGSRARVPATRKAWLMMRVLSSSMRPTAAEAQPGPLNATRFLVDAVAAAPSPAHSASRRHLEDDVSWVLDLFVRLENRKRENARAA
ncbi:MAG: phytoene/squalene synthase family protein [Hyphomonadaceae bacterium]|nr:phytoene/squalene synthase family protein [Hyphomonadaceae bacterium]